MNKKIIGMLIFILFIATAVSQVESLKNDTINTTVPGVPPTSVTTNWTEMEKLLASDGEAGDNFGCCVSLNGDTTLIGAWLDGDNGDLSGSAYVFTRTSTNWTQQAKLLASDGAASDLFGWSVSLDNDTALIGAYWDNDMGFHAGSAYVFTRIGSTWVQQAKLLASDGATMDYFGYSVSLSGDTALVTAPLDDDNGDASGSTYVFTRIGTTWTQQAKLLAADGEIGDNFGNRVFLAGDTTLIGADGDDGIRGSAYVFTRTGTTWTQQAKLLASDGQGEDFFGDFVSLSGDTALIGAAGDDDNGDWSGSAYVFTRTGSTWTQQAKLLASDGYAWDYFGDSVSLSGDTALITAPQDDDNGDDSGSAYVFTRTGTVWTEQQKLLASDGQAGDTFGWLSVSLDGDSAIISSCRDDDNGLDSGSAYVFIKVSENQPPVADFSWTLQNPNTNQQITFDASASHDPDGTITGYEWDWNNDGTFEESHTAPTATHSWATKGSYPVTVRVTDDDSATSTTTKTVIVNGTVSFTLDITGGFGIKAAIKNNGTLDATNIQWKFTLIGGLILLGKTKSGTITSLATGKSTTAKDSPIMGFGKTTIKVEVTCAEGISFTKSVPGSVFLFFVLGVK